MQRITALMIATALAATLGGPTFAAGEPAKPAAQSASHDEHHKDAASLSTGEVKQVDKSAGKITIKHGPLANLDMPPMTMVFRVKEPAMLDQVKPGDKVSFVAEKVGGALTVTQLAPAK